MVGFIAFGLICVLLFFCFREKEGELKAVLRAIKDASTDSLEVTSDLILKELKRRQEDER